MEVVKLQNGDGIMLLEKEPFATVKVRLSSENLLGHTVLVKTSNTYFEAYVTPHNFRRDVLDINLMGKDDSFQYIKIPEIKDLKIELFVKEIVCKELKID